MEKTTVNWIRCWKGETDQTYIFVLFFLFYWKIYSFWSTSARQQLNDKFNAILKWQKHRNNRISNLLWIAQKVLRREWFKKKSVWIVDICLRLLHIKLKTQAILLISRYSSLLFFFLSLSIASRLQCMDVQRDKEGEKNPEIYRFFSSTSANYYDL